MNDLTVTEPANADAIRSRILTIRGVQVMLSSNLSNLYEVEVKYLHRQVKRNTARFPSDFVIHLSPEEVKGLRCQNVTSKRGGDRYGLLAFTEQGIAMLSSVLKSERAAEVNVAIMRTFVAMRRALASITPLLSRIEETDRRQIADQAKNDANQARNEERFKLILDAMQDKKFPPQKHGEYAIVEMCKQTLRRFKISGLEAANRTDDNPVVLSPIGKIAVGDENHQKRRLFHPRHVNLAGDGEKR